MKTVPIFITSLARKKAELEAEAEYHEKRAAKAREAIAQIQGTLDLFEEGKWVRSERRSYRENTGPFKWRELPRLVLDIVRDAGRPISTREITEAVIDRSGIVLEADKDRIALRKRVTAAINDKRRQGVIRSAGVVGLLNQWEIDPDGENVRAQQYEAMKAAKRDARAKRSREIATRLRGRS
jgi:hypothetical protein